MTDQSVIGCIRVGQAVMVAPNSIIVKCEDCAQNIWLAPRSQSILKEGKVLGLNIVPVCEVCLPVRIDAAAEDGEPTELSTTPDDFLRSVMREQQPDDLQGG